MAVGVFVPRSGRVIAARTRRAGTPLERARGLLAGPPLEPSEALVIERARQVHTFGMRYTIDVCFCDRSWRVLHVVHGMRPRRVTCWVRGGFFVLEMRTGELEGLRRGDQLSLVDRSDR